MFLSVSKTCCLQWQYGGTLTNTNTQKNPCKKNKTNKPTNKGDMDKYVS